MYFKIVASIFLFGLLCTNAERKRYDGFQQWFVTPQTKEHIDLLRSFGDDVMFSDGQVSRIGEKVEMLVSPDAIRKYSRLMHGMTLEVGSRNIQNYLDAEEARRAAKSNMAYDIEDFNTPENIYAEMDRLAAEDCPPTFTCSVYSIGSSYEGRPLQVLSITSSTSHHSIWMDSLIHAREWLTGATLMRMTDHLLKEYGTDADAKHLLDNYDFYIVPVMNPDGYQFSWDVNPYWRKSRNGNIGSSCKGTDLNRNYDAIFFREMGTSDDPCSDLYHGGEPNSQPETQAVVDETLRLNSEGRLIVWLSYHAYASAWLIPYGGSDTYVDCYYPEDYDDMLQAAQAAVQAVKSVDGQRWPAANACSGLYAASGVTMDFAEDPDIGAGVKYSFTPEIRGPAFQPNPSVIEPSYLENWAGLVALVAEMEIIEGF